MRALPAGQRDLGGVELGQHAVLALLGQRVLGAEVVVVAADGVERAVHVAVRRLARDALVAPVPRYLPAGPRGSRGAASRGATALTKRGSDKWWMTRRVINLYLVPTQSLVSLRVLSMASARALSPMGSSSVSRTCGGAGGGGGGARESTSVARFRASLRNCILGDVSIRGSRVVQCACGVCACVCRVVNGEGNILISLNRVSTAPRGPGSKAPNILA